MTILINKSKMKNQYKIFGLFLFSGVALSAQTTNVGDLVILPNTQVSILDDFNNTPTGSAMNDGELFVYANFNNDGLFSYFPTETTSLIRFVGPNVQKISGLQESDFYKVIFNNATTPSAFELSGDINVFNTADFLKGIVNNDAFGGRFVFENNGYHLSTSNAGHVNGLVSKKGNKSFVYPIGDGLFYRPSEISAPTALSDNFTSKYFRVNSNTLYPHKLKAGIIETIDDAEYWTLTRDNGSSYVRVTLSWNEQTTPQNLLTSPKSALHVLRWDETLGMWVDEGGIVDEANKTVSTISDSTGFGIFTLGRVKEDLVLPGNLVIYNAISFNGDEKNSFFFIDGIAKYPNNSLLIFNRWGVKVYEAEGYNETDNVFNGFSNGRITIDKQSKLPTGTYFYILNYEYTDSSKPQLIRKSGYLYINSD
ncbi:MULTISPECIES: gliding motility-associated C-terminal domain-containing protein [Flavobacterium]|uniref:gliding motility-associated C-terminal domain-containing protein n=1 Tax=Flavobacterium TaxID=237 RepID=UPI0021157673|nr:MULTISPECIES: gliding motility-associated C-terminal domain-containing protein [Flavobacterium]UUF12407.1 gliding motility-associated C-terminal domain-containing protein [Flavobacterium panici]